MPRRVKFRKSPALLQSLLPPLVKTAEEDSLFSEVAPGYNALADNGPKSRSRTNPFGSVCQAGGVASPRPGHFLFRSPAKPFGQLPHPLSVAQLLHSVAMLE